MKLSLAPVVSFHSPAQAERARVLEIASHAVPLLQAALREENARLIAQVFAVLGDVASGADPRARMAAISLVGGEVVALRPAGSP